MTAVHPFPRLRWLAVVWLAIYLPSYTLAYGVPVFLYLCNIGVVITAIGLLAGNRLLLSSQAIAAIFVGLVWVVDFSARLLTGDHLLGVTAYMWDPQYPLFTRLLSLYHLGWPLLLLYVLTRIGYDRRAYSLQCAAAAVVMVACRLLTTPAENINFVFIDPVFKRQLGPAPLHLLVVFAATALMLYGPAHLALRRAFAPARVAPEAIEAEVREAVPL